MAVAGGAVVKRELAVYEHGLETTNAIYYPLYERHDLGVRSEDIPTQVDIYFMEGSVTGNGLYGLFDPGLKKLVTTRSYAYPPLNIKVEFLSKEVLIKLAEWNSELMLGDIYIPESIGVPEGLASGLLNAGVLLASLRSLLTKRQDDEPVTRRGLMKVLAGIGVLWGASNATVLPIKLLQTERQSVVQRILSRIGGGIGNFHPQYLYVFYRNLLMANKLLLAAEDFTQRTERKARIAFQVESGHSGIEDFLLVGQDLCRKMILCYPKHLTRLIAGWNKGLEDFCSARLFRLSSNLIKVDSQTNSKVLDLDKLDGVPDRRIIDDKLLASLRS